MTRVVIRYDHDVCFFSLKVLHRDGLRFSLRRISDSVRNIFQERFNHLFISVGLLKLREIVIPSLNFELRDNFWRVKAVVPTGFL